MEGTMESLLCVNDIMRCISTSRGLLRRRWAALEYRLRALVKRRGFWAGEWVVLVAGDVAMVIRRRVVVEAGGWQTAPPQTAPAPASEALAPRLRRRRGTEPN